MGIKKNKNKKEDLTSSSQFSIGVGDNKVIFSVTNSGQHQQKKPQYYSQSDKSYKSKQLGVNNASTYNIDDDDDDYASGETMFDVDEYDENTDVSDDDDEGEVIPKNINKTKRKT